MVLHHEPHRGTPASRAATARLLVALVLAATGAVQAADIGQVKVVRGQVAVERGPGSVPAVAGLRLQAADTVRTGSDGAVGITMNDDSLLSAGPNSVLSLDRFVLEASTGQGVFAATLSRGTLAVVSGRLAKQSPDAMQLRTPRTILGVRGTEFVVTVGD
jgi:hypothetical protein